MPIAIISSTKYDGSLHYHFEADLVSESAEEIRVYMPPNSPFDGYRGSGRSKSHSLRIFYPQRHWNLFMRWYPDWRFEEFYVNISSPAQWDGRVMKWIDLDLDVILTAGHPEPKLDDEDEFSVHKTKWGYPVDLVQQCWASVEEVWSLMKSRTHPFDIEMETWRP